MLSFEPFRHLAYINDLRSKLEKPLRFNLSDSCTETLSLNALLSMADEDELAELSLGYATIQGAPYLRAQIAELHRANADDVVTFCGAQEALFAAFNHVLQPGDEVINLSPAYPSLLSIPKQLGATVKSIELQFERQWQFDIDDIKSRLSDKTKLIVLNSPHNPTGSVMSQSLATQILELARERGIYIMSDEVSVWSDYNDLALGYPFVDYDKSIVIGVMSKSFGLAGVRIGWAVSTDPQLRQRLMDIRGYTSICGSVTDEYLATVAIRDRDAIFRRNNQLTASNIALFRQFIKDSQGKFEWIEPQAGMLTLVKANPDIDIHQLAEQLAIEQQLLILPGDLFGIKGNYFRLGLGRANFEEALARFKAIL